MKKNVLILLIVFCILVISTFLIEFHYIYAYTVEELIKDVDKCAAIEGELERLEAYDNFAQSLGVSYTTPDTKVKEKEESQPEKIISDSKKYTVQVGAYLVKKNVQDIIKKLSDKGYQTYVFKGKTLYIVQTGEFENYQEAQNISQKLKKLGYPNFITVKIEGRVKQPIEENTEIFISTVEELIKDIDKCAAIEGELERLEAYDNFAQSLGINYPKVVHSNIEESGKWEVVEVIDPVDNTKTIMFILENDNEKSVNEKPITLVLRYKGKKTEAYIVWNSYLGDRAEVISKFGNQKAFRRYLYLSSDHKATFYGPFAGKEGPSNAIDFIRELMKIDKFFAQIKTYNKNSINAVFYVRELKKAVEPFEDILHWIEN